MAQKYSAFSYISGNSFLHKCPSWIKILFIPVINIIFLFLPAYFCLFLIILQISISFLLKFSFKQQLADLKPVIFYAFLLFLMEVFTCIFSEQATFAQRFNFQTQKESIFLLLKLFCMMQSASLVFKTSTSLQLRDGIEKIELCLRKILHLKEKTSFTNAISMFLNFIPMVTKIWAQTQKAWFARGGKKSVKMYLTLLPILFSVGMKKAWNTARAMEVRNA